MRSHARTRTRSQTTTLFPEFLIQTLSQSENLLLILSRGDFSVWKWRRDTDELKRLSLLLLLRVAYVGYLSHFLL